MHSNRAVSSAVEHRSYKPGATGSIPVPPIFQVKQLATNLKLLTFNDELRVNDASRGF